MYPVHSEWRTNKVCCAICLWHLCFHSKYFFTSCSHCLNDAFAIPSPTSTMICFALMVSDSESLWKNIYTCNIWGCSWLLPDGICKNEPPWSVDLFFLRRFLAILPKPSKIISVNRSSFCTVATMLPRESTADSKIFTFGSSSWNHATRIASIGTEKSLQVETPFSSGVCWKMEVY